MPECRQLRDDVLVQSDLPRDGPQALDSLCQRPVIEFVEVGDAKAAHLPLALAVPGIPSGPVDPQVMMEQQRSQSESDISIGLAVVDAVPVLESHSDDLAFAANGNRDAVELPVFTEGAVLRLGVPGGARERQQVLFFVACYPQNGPGVVLVQALLNPRVSVPCLAVRLANPGRVEPFPDSWHRLVVNDMRDGGAAVAQLEEMDTLLLAENGGKVRQGTPRDAPWEAWRG